MVKVVGLDIAAIILLVVLFVSCVYRKMTIGRSNRIFMSIMLATAAAAAFDVAAITLDNAHSTNTFALYFTHGGYLLLHFLNAPLHLLYVISLSDSWHRLYKNKFMQIVLLVPAVVMIGALFANIGNRMVYSVAGGYERGPWFVLMYITTTIYILYVVAYLIAYRKILGAEKTIVIAMMIPITVVAMIVQYAMPGMRVEMFGGAIGMLLISNGIQKPEDYIDSFTRLLKFSKYSSDMKRNYANQKPVTVILLNIANFHTIRSMISFDSLLRLLRETAEKINHVNQKLHGRAHVYYLDDGRFRLVFERRHERHAEAAADLLCKRLKETVVLNGLDIQLAPVIVLAQCPEELTDFTMLMSFGLDFHKKNYYTGRVLRVSEIFSQSQLDIQNNIDDIIDRALEEGSFQVYYQPIYSLQQGRFVSAEALIRLIDPHHGFISPETLITAAEQSGAIHKIGEFVFEKVCQFVASSEFKKLGLDYIEVNLSVVQVMNSDLPDMLLSIMDRYAVSPENINLEITETAAAYEQKVLTDNLTRLVQAGLSFSLDDYGTGYSNMKRVISLPVRIIKIDKSFVDDNNDPKMWIFIENTIKMLKDMNMEIVVEGVETQEMLDMFSDLNCDFIQGYFFSRPIPQKDFVAFIMNANKSLTTSV